MTTPAPAYPAQVLNLTNWKLTLPIGSSGSPTEIKQPALAKYVHTDFFKPEGGGVRFRAPVNGVTTSGSANPRSELREMNGSANASWSSSDGKTHTMVIDQAITHLPNARTDGGTAAVVVGQIHDADDDICVFRLEGRKLWLTSGNNTHYKLITDGYELGTRFKVAFSVLKDVVSVFFNGELVDRLPAKFSGAYFKAGAYTQANSKNSKPADATNYGEVIVYAVTVAHGVPVPTPDPAPVPQPVPSGAQTLGVGGVATPAGAKLATADSIAPLTITSQGVYDGQGHKVGRITVKASGVTVQNYRIVAGGQYGAVLDADDVTLQNCDISGITPSGDGDLNAITAFGDRIKIRYNTAINFVSGDPGDSHTDFIQTWVSGSHPKAGKDWEIVGNKATGPANPGRDLKVPSIHQFLMVEGAGQGGNTGGSGKPSGWLIADNEIGDSWNQAIKLDGVDNFTITRNRFVGSSDHVIEVTDASTNVRFLDDNVIGNGYGSIGTEVVGGGTTTPGGGPVPTIPKAKRTIIMLRHGEKDDNNDGKDDVLHELSVTGKKRAEALKKAWTASQLPAGLPKPDRCIASKGNTASNRPLKTIEPLQLALGLPMNKKYDFEKDYKTVGPWLAQRLDVTMVCLEHSAIINTFKLLGKVTGLPKAWDAKRFDLYWVFTSDDGKNWTLTQVPQLLLPGDSDKPIK